MKKPWWQEDSYDTVDPVPNEFNELAGPKGLALVRAFPDGRTDQGWGLMGPKDDRANGFMPRYLRGEFNDRRVLYGYNRGKHAFAFIMRSVQLVCIDIDGKNGGLEHAKRLGMLPPTMAETSKSGAGYHLFYRTDEAWDDMVGFGLLADRIGIEQGVDFRAVGCVYHHDTQRWNGRAPVKLPHHLHDLLLHRGQQHTAAAQHIQKVLATGDEMEILMLHDELELELSKPIPQGKRNNTLFAIGNKMKNAGVDSWDDKLRVRAEAVGLGHDEIEKLVSNISTYGPPEVP